MKKNCFQNMKKIVFSLHDVFSRLRAIKSSKIGHLSVFSVPKLGELCVKRPIQRSARYKRCKYALGATTINEEGEINGI